MSGRDQWELQIGSAWEVQLIGLLEEGGEDVVGGREGKERQGKERQGDQTLQGIRWFRAAGPSFSTLSSSFIGAL